MPWHTKIAETGPALWLIVATIAAFLALLSVLIVQTRRHARLRNEMTGLGGVDTLDPPGAVEPATALEGNAMSPLDRVFPRKPLQFLMLVGIVALGTWIVGWLLAPDRRHFMSSPEWLFQPFYIAAHLIALRLFINVFTRNYAAGVAHLDVSRKEALRGVRPILGLTGVIAAALVALPFCYFDFRYLFSPRYARMGGDDVVRAIDYVMWSVWSLEWFINALIWVMLLGFMIKSFMIIGRHPFRQPIDIVLHDKQYRPFLQMSAQGSSVVLGFSLVTVAYLVYTGGELTDYLGLGITVTLLVVCFVPPWLLLRSKVDHAVRMETLSLRHGAGLATSAGTGGAIAALAGGSPGAGNDASLDLRVNQALALLRIWHLQNLYGNLGQTEATAILVRLLAPAATIGWQVANNYGDMAQRLGKLLGPMSR